MVTCQHSKGAPSAGCYSPSRVYLKAARAKRIDTLCAARVTGQPVLDAIQ